LPELRGYRCAEVKGSMGKRGNANDRKHLPINPFTHLPLLHLMRPCWLLLLLGSMDLATTLYFYRATRWLGEGIEGNRVAARILGYGMGWLVLFKMAAVVGPIGLLEWAKRREIGVRCVARSGEARRGEFRAPNKTG